MLGALIVYVVDSNHYLVEPVIRQKIEFVVVVWKHKLGVQSKQKEALASLQPTVSETKREEKIVPSVRACASVCLNEPLPLDAEAVCLYWE